MRRYWGKEGGFEQFPLGVMGSGNAAVEMVSVCNSAARRRERRKPLCLSTRDAPALGQLVVLPGQVLGELPQRPFARSLVTLRE